MRFLFIVCVREKGVEYGEAGGKIARKTKADTRVNSKKERGGGVTSNKKENIENRQVKS